MSKTVLAVLLAASSLEGLAAQSQPPYSREIPFKGRKLDGQVFLCKSDQVAGAGYRLDVSSGGWVEAVDVSKQKIRQWSRRRFRSHWVCRAGT
jgi:hypothetical protein